MRPPLLTALLALSVSCASHPPTLVGAAPAAASAASAPPSEDPAPYPFTVDEIRAGCPKGRAIEFARVQEGAAPRYERWTFEPVDEDSVQISTVPIDASGNPTGALEAQTARWAELHEHARFPKSATQISTERVTVPAGTFDAMKYVVTTGDTVKTLWFAKTLPGPPVKMEVVKGGSVRTTMTMQADKRP